MEEAPTPQMDNETYIKDMSFPFKLDNIIYTVKIGKMKEYLVINLTNESNINIHYTSYFTLDELKNISKSLRYYDNIKDIISFMEEKMKTNEVFLKKENSIISIEFKILSPNGKIENISLELKPQEKSDKEIISILVKKVGDLETKVQNLESKINQYEDILNILSKNKKNISSLFADNNIMKNKVDKIEDKIETKIIDSNITNINDIDFIINRLKQSPIIYKKNFKFKLLYRGTRDGDDTNKLFKMCEKKQNIIIFMKSEQGSIFGGFSNIGWEERPKGKHEHPIDDNSFLFSLDNKKIFNAKKGKSKICWVNGDEYGLMFFGTLGFFNQFLKKISPGFPMDYDFSSTFENCSIKYFNSGRFPFKFSELEVFQII